MATRPTSAAGFLAEQTRRSAAARPALLAARQPAKFPPKIKPPAPISSTLRPDPRELFVQPSHLATLAPRAAAKQDRPMTYRAPVADIAFALKHAAGLPGAGARALRRPRRATCRRRAGGGRQVRQRRDRAAQSRRRQVRHAVQGRRGHHAARLEGGLYAPGPPPAGTGSPRPPNGAARTCRTRSTPPASRCGIRRSMAFGIGPVLTMAAIDALAAHGTDELKATYLAKLISGEWMGTMQLTEPQAGSDVGALRTKAERAGDGTYRITGSEDLHHLWRARPHRQHHPFRAGAAARRAGRHQRHLAVPGAEISGRRRRRSARATTCARIRSSTSSASMPRRPAPWSMATTAAPSASSSARSTRAWPACSR